jgi:phosphate uptake regulator
MKRRIIKQGNNAYTLTLPVSWIRKNSLTPKDELDVSEHGRILKIFSERGSEKTKGEIDVTGCDASSLWHVIRSLYEKGLDEIILNFKNLETDNFKTKERERTSEIIQECVNKLIGIEIIDRGHNFIKIKELAESKFDEFYPTLRRVFLLLIKASEDFSEGVETNSTGLLKSMQSQHDTISKFLSFCLRLLNKIGDPNPKKTTFYYRIIIQLHEITDIYKFTSQWIITLNNLNKKIKEQICDIIDKVNRSFKLFYELFYKYNTGKLLELSKNLIEIREEVDKMASSKFPYYDLMILARVTYITYIIEFLIEAKIGLGI